MIRLGAGIGDDGRRVTGHLPGERRYPIVMAIVGGHGNSVTRPGAAADRAANQPRTAVD